MAQTSDRRPGSPARSWIAFTAGAVAMLAIVLLWLALSRAHEAAGMLRANVAMPKPALPSLPTAPPPEGPRLPPVPTPQPR
jgi:spore maturation protein SpmA